MAAADLGERSYRMKTDIVTLPAYWVCALVNGDYSGLDENEAARCRAAEVDLARHGGWRVVSTADGDDGEARFTWRYRLYDPAADCDGGEVVDYVVATDF